MLTDEELFILKELIIVEIGTIEKLIKEVNADDKIELISHKAKLSNILNKLYKNRPI